MAAPLAWLSLAIVGVLLLCAGIVIEAYRHHDGGAASDLISSSSPGAFVSIAGIVLIAVGLLAAVSLLELQAGPSVDSGVRRAIVVVAAWTAVAAVIAGAGTYVGTQGLTLGRGPQSGEQRLSAPGIDLAPTALPGAADRVTLRGSLTIDGAPLDAEFLGAQVKRDGLAAACQQDTLPVAGGQYELVVLADAEVRGCGAPGASVVLWVFIQGQFLWSLASAPWPPRGSAATFDARFSRTTPDGAAAVVTEFFGEVSHRDGSPVAGGTVIEAYIGEARCGLGSVRRSGFTGYNLSVAGPEVAGCARGATVAFRVGGQLAHETAVNDVGQGISAHTVNLTID